MTRQRLYRWTIVLVLVALVSGSCSTKKNTFTRRAYHSLTCHYNVYWNGMVSVDDGAQDLAKTVKDDYTKTLRLYNYGTAKEAVGLNPKMDRAIKKASIGIQRHSMYFGGRELNRWVRESYFMMGLAHFYKQDYTSARRVFDFVAKEYEGSSIHYEALLWLAKTYLQQERYEKCEATLNLLQSEADDSNFPVAVERAIPLVYADFYLAREDYQEAYPYLQRGLELNHDRELVTRIDYIMGQINQQTGDLDKASEYYARVIKRNPPFEMAFQAKLNMARCYDEGSGSSKFINKVLLKMATEAKNKDNLDQIYFALAEVAEKDGQDTLAISYLRKSVQFSLTNQVQKSASALHLADIFFERSNYPMAQAYYDTAVSALPRDYEGYDQIKAKTDVLSEIVVHLQVLQRQDSLQRLASMDTTHLYAIIDKMIADYNKEQERLAAEREEMQQGGVQFIDPNRGNKNPNLTGGKWYFYNPAAMGFGRTEFQKKWGTRKLEDLWRLSDKQSVMQTFEENLTAEGPMDAKDSTLLAAGAAAGNPKTRSFYLADIPKTQADFELSDSLMTEAYSALGNLYFEALRDSVSALTTYQEFIDRYPENNYRLEAWYALYRLYFAKGEQSKSDFYKGLILNQFPESLYAKVINDPDYFEKLSAASSEAEALYEKAWNAYNKEQYFRVMTYAEKGIADYPNDTAVTPRFMFLKAMSQGVLNVPDTMYRELEYLSVNYPHHSVAPLARTIMRTLEQEYGLGPGANQRNTLDSTQAALVPYQFNPDETHLVIYITDADKVNANALKIRLSDFNKKFFEIKGLKVKSLMLDNDRTLVTIGNFDQEGEATNYLMALRNDTYVNSGMAPDEFSLFSISLGNYPLFYKDKNVEGYEQFWKENYPQR